MKQAEYRYSARSAMGALACLISLAFMVASVIGALQVHWLFAVIAVFALLLLAVALLAFVRGSEWGCCVTEIDVSWWELAWPATEQSIRLDQIASAELYIGEESNHILITETNGAIRKIGWRFSGNGRDIINAIQTHIGVAEDANAG